MGHFYKRDGSTCYSIVGKNGKPRAPYIKEAKELGLAPGVTTIIGQIASGGLQQYFTNLAIETCKNNPFCEMGESGDSWIKSIKTKLAVERDRITNQGSAIHDALEKYYKTGVIDNEQRFFITPVIELMEETWPDLKRTDWIAERSFNYKGFYGGKVDISTEAAGGIILDFKTKDSTDISKFKAYESHKQQLAAYSYGLNMPSAKCGNIFLSALTPDMVKLEMHDDLSDSWSKFKLLLQYWMLDNYGISIEE